jgi:hypothetical protein
MGLFTTKFGYQRGVFRTSTNKGPNEALKLTRCTTEKYVQCLAALFAHIFRPRNGQLS